MRPQARRRSIRAVFRVQCGMCKGWLSRTQEYVPGTDVQPHHSETLATAERAWLWPGEGAARRAALAAGWVPDRTQSPGSGVLLCPDCSANSPGIVLPANSRVRFYVIGPPGIGETPYAYVDRFEARRRDPESRARAEDRARDLFANQHPGQEIVTMGWVSLPDGQEIKD